MEKAQNVVDDVSKRHRAIDRKLRGVEFLSEQDSALLLQCNGSIDQEDSDPQVNIAPLETVGG
jgi:hypothetical protein